MKEPKLMEEEEQWWKAYEICWDACFGQLAITPGTVCREVDGTESRYYTMLEAQTLLLSWFSGYTDEYGEAAEELIDSDNGDHTMFLPESQEYLSENFIDYREPVRSIRMDDEKESYEYFWDLFWDTIYPALEDSELAGLYEARSHPSVGRGLHFERRKQFFERLKSENL